jgi:hypothetical protein
MSVASTRPVIERIMQVVEQRLQVMTTGIYPNSPVVEVIRPLRTDSWTPRSYQILIYLNEQVESEGLMRPGNPPAIAYDARIALLCHVMPSETDTTPFDEYCNTFYADIVEALTDSGNPNWYDFGNLAFNASIGSPEPLGADGGVDGFLVNLTVTYRVSEWSPYQVRG